MRDVVEALAELEETLAVTRVYEGRLQGADAHYYGLCRHDQHAVYIDPAPAMVETLIHELVHARYPSWSERRVRRETARLFAGMTDADVDRWFRRYQRVKRRARKMQADA